MKKIGAILLLIVVLFNTAGFFIAFKVAQYSVKKEIKQTIKNNLPKEVIAEFTFTKEEFAALIWEEEEKEFFLGKSMYDIISIEKVGNNIKILCLNDTQEKKLFSHLETQINKELSTSKPFNGKQAKLVLDNIVQLLFFSNSQINFASAISNYCYTSNSFMYKSIFLDHTSPPPKTV